MNANVPARVRANSFWANPGLALLSLVLTFGALETAFRVFGAHKAGGIRPVDDRLVFELVPGHELKIHKLRVNADGLADRAYKREKDPGVIRIAVVGDSTSFPHKVGMGNAYPDVLEERLNARGPGKYEVINFSVPGYNTAQEYELIRRKVLGFSPDIVFLAFCNNDVGIPFWFKPRLTPLNFLFHKSAFFHWIILRLDGYIEDKNGGPEPRAAWFSFKKNILGMHYPEMRISGTPGLETAPTDEQGFTPWKEKVPERYAHMTGTANYARYLGLIRDLLAEEKVLFISAGYYSEQFREGQQLAGLSPVSLTGFLKNEKERRREKGIEAVNFTIPGDGHLNAEGHRIVGEALAEYFFSGILPRFSAAEVPFAETSAV